MFKEIIGLLWESYETDIIHSVGKIQNYWLLNEVVHISH